MSQNRRVLIVDDEEDFLFILSSALSEFCQVHTANGVQSAMALLKKMTFDVAILDVYLDDGDAFEIAEFVKSIGRYPPIFIFISAFNEPVNRERSWKFRAEDFVTKPFDLAEFTQKIRNKIHNIATLRESLKQPFVGCGETSNLALIVEDQSHLNARDQEFLDALLNYFIRHCDNLELNLDSVSCGLGYSKRSFQRMLKDSTRSSFVKVLSRFRTHFADALLHENYSIKEVARICGYRSASYFSTKFKDEFGVTPRSRREQINRQIQARRLDQTD